MARLPQGVRRRPKDGLLEKRFTIKGKRYSVYAGTTKELAEKEQELREYIKTSIHISNRNITLNEFFDRWIELKETNTKSNSLNTYRRMYNKHIKDYMGHRKIVDIERTEVLELQAKLSKKLKPVSVNYVITVLNIILNDALKSGIISTNPASKIKTIEQEEKAAETIHRALTLEEQETFMKALEGSYYYHYMALMLCTGMRCGEVGALTWNDIDYKNNVIHINKTVTRDSHNKLVIGSPKTKAGKRDIPLNDRIIKILEDRKGMYNNILPFSTTNIFMSVYGNFVANSQINCEILRVLNRLNKKGVHIDKFTSHAFRDTFATRYIEQGGQMQTLKELLGHASITETMDTYAHVLPSTKQDEMQKIVIAF